MNRSRQIGSPLRPKAFLAFSSWACLVLLASEAGALELSLQPARVDVAPDTEFTIELTADAAPDSFNGYDMVLGYDPSKLTLLGMSASQQEGPLFTNACPQRFHKFTIDADSTAARVAHVLLCAGTDVKGPGVLYRVHFRSGIGNFVTHLRLLEGTAVYDAGTYVDNLSTADAVVAVGDVTASPIAPAQVHLSASPNPFNPTTIIRWQSPRAGRHQLTIYSIRGRLVDTLLDEWLSAGPHEFTWSSAGHVDLASGTYFLQLSYPTGRAMARATLLK